MKDILAVSLNKSYRENISKEDLERITRGNWRIAKNNIEHIKYIVGVKNKNIKSIYKINNYCKHEKRYCFEVGEVDNSIYKGINEKFNNKDELRMYGAIRYLNSEDLK